MIIVLLVTGIAVLVAGLAAIVFGIEVKEFSLGNTLILSGVISACSGLLTLGLAIVVRELTAIAWRLGSADEQPPARGRGERPSAVFPEPEPAEEPARGGPLFLRDQSALETGAAPVPWQDEAARDRGRQRGAPPPLPLTESAPETKPRRDLLFSSLSRKERDRAGGRASAPIPGDPDSVALAAQQQEPALPSPFEDAWPPPEPLRPDSFRRAARRPSAFNTAPPAAAEDRSQVTILKSGVVDGMAYSLYSDGSIEAQLPEGMMRFGSIGELRAHLDQRP